MDSEIDRLVSTVEGDGPSPEFVARLRAIVVDEAQAAAPSTDDAPINVDLRADIGVSPSSSSPWRWGAVAAATIAVVVGTVVVGFERLDRGDTPSAITSRPAASETTIPATDSTVPTTAGAVNGGGEPDRDEAGFIPDAERLVDTNAALDLQTYRIDTLATPLSLTIAEPLWVRSNTRGHVSLAHPAGRGGLDRGIHLMRASAFVDPEQPTAGFDSDDDGWPADDAVGWIEQLSAEFVVTDRADTTVGGRPAHLIELGVGENACGVGEVCSLLATNHLVAGIELVGGVVYRVWIVDQDGEDPLIIVAAISREEDRDWFDVADALVTTIGFGEVAPNPVVATDAGPNELPIVGGIRADLDDGWVVTRGPDGSGTVALAELPGGAQLVATPVAADGTPIETVADLVDHLVASSADVGAQDDVVIDGWAGEVFEVTGAPPDLTLLAETDTAARPFPALATIWAVEQPDRGLIAIIASAADNTDIVYPLSVDLATQLVESLEFIDVG